MKSLSTKSKSQKHECHSERLSLYQPHHLNFHMSWWFNHWNIFLGSPIICQESCNSLPTGPPPPRLTTSPSLLSMQWNESCILKHESIILLLKIQGVCPHFFQMASNLLICHNRFHVHISSIYAPPTPNHEHYFLSYCIFTEFTCP